MYIVYILYSQDLDRYYIGFTSNLEVRMNFHFNDTQVRKYTKKANDWEEFLKMECETKRQAMGVENHVKRMKSRVYIQNLKKFPEMRQKLIEKYLDC